VPGVPYPHTSHLPRTERPPIMSFKKDEEAGDMGTCPSGVCRVPKRLILTHNYPRNHVPA
jgi:hypothetical protein